MIYGFNGRFRFLSNFYERPFEYKGIVFNNAESAFQGEKTGHREDLEMFSSYSPGEAKKKGKKVNLRNDWETVKVDIMEDILRAKFSDNKLKIMLIDTYPADLIEANCWNDTYWGVCNGVGKNVLGKLLMKVREDLRS